MKMTEHILRKLISEELDNYLMRESFIPSSRRGTTSARYRVKSRYAATISRVLNEEPKEDKDFNPANVDLPIPDKLKRLLDPDLSPQKFADFDAELDDSGTPAHQAFALAAFALTYADNDEAAAKALMQKASTAIVTIVKAMSDKAVPEKTSE
jgi:hypothetical protein